MFVYDTLKLHQGSLPTANTDDQAYIPNKIIQVSSPMWGGSICDSVIFFFNTSTESRIYTLTFGGTNWGIVCRCVRIFLSRQHGVERDSAFSTCARSSCCDQSDKTTGIYFQPHPFLWLSVWLSVCVCRRERERDEEELTNNTVRYENVVPR